MHREENLMLVQYLIDARRTNVQGCHNFTLSYVMILQYKLTDIASMFSVTATDFE